MSHMYREPLEKPRFPWAYVSYVFGSELINSPLRYRCATPDQGCRAASLAEAAGRRYSISPLEARAGIEPTYKDLQSSA